MTVEDRRGIESDAVLPDEDTCRLRRIVMARHVSPVAVSRPGEDLRAVEAVLGNFPDGAGRGERARENERGKQASEGARGREWDFLAGDSREQDGFGFHGGVPPPAGSLAASHSRLKRASVRRA